MDIHPAPPQPYNTPLVPYTPKYCRDTLYLLTMGVLGVTDISREAPPNNDNNAKKAARGEIRRENPWMVVIIAAESRAATLRHKAF